MPSRVEFGVSASAKMALFKMYSIRADQAFAQILILLLNLDIDEGQVREIRRILAEVRQGGYREGWDACHAETPWSG